MSTITTLFGFDMETDVGSWTPFYEGLKHGTPKLLDLLGRKGAQATFFYTGEAATIEPEMLPQIARLGHEVGCHSLYHETVGDALFEIPGVKPLLPEEVPLRLQRGHELVEQALGDRPVSFRCPRLWGSTAVCNALNDMGYVADASYPMYFYEKQLVPYHPSREDWTEKGDLTLVEIPNFCDMGMVSTDQYHRDRDQWPLWRTESAESLMRHVDSFIEYVEQRDLPVVLCFYMHPWEFMPMQAEYHFGEGTVIPDPFIIKGCGDYSLEQLGVLIDLLQERGAQFKTAKQIAAEWA